MEIELLSPEPRTITIPEDHVEQLSSSSKGELPPQKLRNTAKPEVNYSQAIDFILGLPQSISKEATPDGVGQTLISRTAKKKLISQMSNLDNEERFAYMQVVPHIEELLQKSLLIEEHRDRVKNEKGDRLPSNEADPNIDCVQRLYGAFSSTGKLYRVKTTIQVFRFTDENESRHHGYDITEVELLTPKTGSLERSLEAHQPLISNSVSLAKLLKDVELSYEPGVKLLDAMGACHELRLTGDGKRMVDVYEKAKAERQSTQVALPLSAVQRAQSKVRRWKYTIKDGRINSSLSVQEIKNAQLSGVQEFRWSNGTLERRCHYKKGQIDGRYEEWDPEGNLRCTYDYKAGKRDGLGQKWNEKGELEERAGWKDGKLDGVMERYDNGRISMRINFKEGKKSGLCEEWNIDGKPTSRILYLNGTPALFRQTQNEGLTTQQHVALAYYQPVQAKSGWLQTGLDGLARKYDSDPSGISDEVSDLAKELAPELKRILKEDLQVTSKQELSKYIRIAPPELQKALGRTEEKHLSQSLTKEERSKGQQLS